MRGLRASREAERHLDGLSVYGVAVTPDDRIWVAGSHAHSYSAVLDPAIYVITLPIEAEKHRGT